MAKAGAKKRVDEGGESAGGRRSDTGYWSAAHTLHRLRFHLVFTPKYRKRVLEGAIAKRIEELFGQACEVKGWEIHELSVQPDHVHMLIQIPPRDSTAEVSRRLKGGSSKMIRSEFPDLTEFLWGNSFWSRGMLAFRRDGYFAESVGQAEERVIRRYIRDQGKGKPNGGD
jgi:putative transposase